MTYAWNVEEEGFSKCPQKWSKFKSFRFSARSMTVTVFIPPQTGYPDPGISLWSFAKGKALIIMDRIQVS